MKQLNYIREIDFCKKNEEITCIGKVIHLRKLGGLQFVIILDQSAKCQCVIDGNTKTIEKITKGLFVEVIGLVAEPEKGGKEILVKELTVISVNNVETKPSKIGSAKLEKLMIRSRIVESIQRFLSGKGFLPVSSPTIVGNWVEGKTHAFGIDYFGNQCYLTLNNMLYHQVMLISGYTNIYEISKVFRKDISNHKNRLSEFCSVDISVSNRDGYYVMSLVEEMIKYVLSGIEADLDNSLDIEFHQVTYSDLMKACGCADISGAQLNSIATQYLKKNYKGFVWVTNFPEEKRRFFVKSENGFCKDYQLWYNGECQIAAGSEREQSLDEMRRKIVQENKQIEQYAGFLAYYENSVPAMAEIGFGLERFIMFVLGCSEISEIVAFPRNRKIFEF